MKLQLIIGNKNYSSWSMRPWVLLRQAQIPFEEVQLSFGDRGGTLFVEDIEKYSKPGKVPVLLVDGEPVWDSLAIAETTAERFPDRQLWPAPPKARAFARSICAEMHSGFQALRGKMPMNIRGRHPGKGLTAETQRDIDRITAIWTQCRERFGSAGPLLFGRFTIPDAYYAPVVMRFRTYGVKLPAAAQAYCEAVLGLAAVREWIESAQREADFVPEDEPYSHQ